MSDASTIQFVEGQLIVALPLDERPAMGQFLDALEAEAKPTHWGSSRGLRDPYDRAALELYVDGHARADLHPYLRGKLPARYEAHWYTGEHGLSAIHILSVGPTMDETASIFAVVEALADLLPTELASVDIRFVDQEASTLMAKGTNVHHLDAFVRCGPNHLFPRTILGPRLVQMMGGPSTLDQSDADVRVLPKTAALAVDLVTDPWTASASALKQAQVSVDRHLRLTGMLARIGGNLRTLPGPRWQPPTATP